MQRSPYTPPTSDAFQHLADGDAGVRRNGRVLAVLGVVFFSGPVWGLIGTVVHMIEAFDKLSAKGDQSKALAQDISGALVFAAIGGAVGLVGVLMVLIAFFGPKNRERWFLRWVIGLAVFWCLLFFPYGLIVGLPMAILFIVNRAEFRSRTDAEQARQALAAD